MITLTKRLITFSTLISFFMTVSGGLYVARAQQDVNMLEYNVPRQFKVTAYYSPLPNQKKYLRGNYAAELKLNGEGIRGASGAGVFPGMLAAPKHYPFGTKIQLDGVGIGNVTDRGGAIVKAGEKGQSYDRIDMWMGYGDEGLERALQWGSRVVTGTILGQISRDTTLDFLQLRSEHATIDRGVIEARRKTGVIPSSTVIAKSVVLPKTTFPVASVRSLGKGMTGEEVKTLQKALRQVGYTKLALTEEYDEDTISAVFDFQKKQGLMKEETDFAAGYFGTATREALVTMLADQGKTSAREAKVGTTTSVGTEATKSIKKTVDTTKGVVAPKEKDTTELPVHELPASSLLIPTMTAKGDFDLLHSRGRVLKVYIPLTSFGG